MTHTDFSFCVTLYRDHDTVTVNDPTEVTARLRAEAYAALYNVSYKQVDAKTFHIDATTV